MSLDDLVVTVVKWLKCWNRQRNGILKFGPRCQSRGTFWHLTAQTGRRSTSSNFRWKLFLQHHSQSTIFLKNSHVFICKIYGRWSFEIISSQVDVEGIVVENLARRCGGFLKSLSLNGCQVNIHQKVLINTISSLSSGSGWLCPVNVCSALQQHRATEP